MWIQLPVIHRGKGRGVKRPRTDSLSAKDGEEVVTESAQSSAVAGDLKTLGPEVIESAMGQLLSLNCITGVSLHFSLNFFV